MKSQVKIQHYLFISTVAVILGVSLYLQYTSSPVSIYKIMPRDFNKFIILFFLLSLAVIFEMLKIVFYKSIITIQVTVTLTILFIFGKNYAILFVMVYYIFSILKKKYKNLRKLYSNFLKYAHHIILTIVASNLFENLYLHNHNKILDLLIAALVYKILNFIIVDLIWLKLLKAGPKIKHLLKIFFLELWIYISSIPLAVLLSPMAKNGTKVYSIDELLSAFYFIVIIAFLIKSYSKKTDLYDRLEYELKKNKSISSKLEKMIKAFRRDDNNMDYKSFTKDIAYQVAHIFEYNYVLINKLNYIENKVERISYYGISEEDFERLKSNPPPISFYNMFSNEENRVSNSFFFSMNSNVDSKYIYYPKIHLLESNYEEGEKTWTKDYTLIVPIGNLKKPLGYISLDQPQNGKFPALDNLRLLELFSQNIAAYFNLLERLEELDKENLTDPITSLYGIRYISKIKENEFKYLLLIDIMSFKDLNIKYGLEKSDLILKKLGKIIKKYTRKKDIVIRYIGDWFLVFTNSKYEEIIKQFKAISIMAKKIEINDEKFEIELQYGIASLKGKKIKDAIFEAKNSVIGSQIISMEGKCQF